MGKRPGWLNCKLFFLFGWPFLYSSTLLHQHQQQNTPNYRLNRKARWMKPFWRFVLSCRDFAIYGTARAELLCTCVASVRVQTLVACFCRSACAVAWRRHLPPYLESPPVCAIGLTDSSGGESLCVGSGETTVSLPAVSFPDIADQGRVKTTWLCPFLLIGKRNRSPS